MCCVTVDDECEREMEKEEVRSAVQRIMNGGENRNTKQRQGQKSGSLVFMVTGRKTLGKWRGMMIWCC